MAVPRPPLPSELAAILSRPNYAVMATVQRDGTPHTAATWYDWDGGSVLLTLDATRRRLRYLRENPAVSLTVFDGQDFLRHVTVSGRAVEFADDPELAVADRLAQRYFGQPYPDRGRPRVSVWVAIDRWHSWDGASRQPLKT